VINFIVLKGSLSCPVRQKASAAYITPNQQGLTNKSGKLTHPRPLVVNGSRRLPQLQESTECPDSWFNGPAKRFINLRFSLLLIAFRAASRTLVTLATRLPLRAVDELHHDEASGFSLAAFVDGNYVGMIER